jgi:HEAT repeat protein
MAEERGTSAAYAFLASLLSPEKPALEEGIVKTIGHWIANEKLSSAERADLYQIVIPFMPAIDSALNSPDPQIRAAAVNCFYAVKDFDPARILRMLADNELAVRLAALNTLAFCNQLSVEKLAHIALNAQEEDVVRITALHSLA